MCCAPSPTLGQNVRHIRIQHQSAPFPTPLAHLHGISHVKCEMSPSFVYYFFQTLFRFDANDAADEMQIAKLENCERFSNLFVY